jgi:hypothetical protein
MERKSQADSLRELAKRVLHPNSNAYRNEMALIDAYEAGKNSPMISEHNLMLLHLDDGTQKSKLPKLEFGKPAEGDNTFDRVGSADGTGRELRWSEKLIINEKEHTVSQKHMFPYWISMWDALTLNTTTFKENFLPISNPRTKKQKNLSNLEKAIDALPEEILSTLPLKDNLKTTQDLLSYMNALKSEDDELVKLRRYTAGLARRLANRIVGEKINAPSALASAYRVVNANEVALPKDLERVIKASKQLLLNRVKSYGPEFKDVKDRLDGNNDLPKFSPESSDSYNPIIWYPKLSQENYSPITLEQITGPEFLATEAQIESFRRTESEFLEAQEQAVRTLETRFDDLEPLYDILKQTWPVFLEDKEAITKAKKAKEKPETTLNYRPWKTLYDKTHWKLFEGNNRKRPGEFIDWITRTMSLRQLSKVLPVAIIDHRSRALAKNYREGSPEYGRITDSRVRPIEEIEIVYPESGLVVGHEKILKEIFERDADEEKISPEILEVNRRDIEADRFMLDGGLTNTYTISIAKEAYKALK